MGTVIQSSMRLFKRKNKGDITPSTHIAFLLIQNEHMGFDETIDLSHLDVHELTAIREHIIFVSELHNVSTVEDMEEYDYEDDGTEYQ